MADIDQTLLAQQRQEKEVREAQTAAKNEEALAGEAVVSIAQIAESRETVRPKPSDEEPEEMEAAIRAEQLEAQNREVQTTEESQAQKAKAAIDQIQQIQKAAKTAQTTARTVNFTTAASIIGLVITFITMNLQLLLGNIFGAKWVPKLETWEMALIGTMDFILWLVIMMTIGLISAIISPFSIIGK